MRKYGYIRVSTSDQSHDRQVDELLPLCDELHIETVSAVKRARPIYRGLRKKLKPGDLLVVSSLDRAFRSSVDATLEAEWLMRRGVSLKIVDLGVDTATVHGMMIYQIVAVIAEFERKYLIQRTREGLAAARRRGTRLGRPPKLSLQQLDAARAKLDVPGTTLTSIASELKVWPWTLSRALRRCESRQVRSHGTKEPAAWSVSVENGEYKQPI